jgi:hypothetical protein
MTPAQYRRWRFYAESLIEQAITILDTIDGDADLEDEGDGEPSLASPVGGESQLCWSAGSDDDREMSLHAVASGLTRVPGSGPSQAR